MLTRSLNSLDASQCIIYPAWRLRTDWITVSLLLGMVLYIRYLFVFRVLSRVTIWNQADVMIPASVLLSDMNNRTKDTAEDGLWGFRI